MNLLEKFIDRFTRAFFGSSKSSGLLLLPASNEVKLTYKKTNMPSKVDLYNSVQKKIDNIVRIPNGIDGIIIFQDGDPIMNTGDTKGENGESIKIDEAGKFASQMFDIYDILKKSSALRMNTNDGNGDDYGDLEVISLKFNKVAYTLGIVEYYKDNNFDVRISVLYFGLLEPKRLSSVHSSTSETERLLIANRYYEYYSAADD